MVRFESGDVFWGCVEGLDRLAEAAVRALAVDFAALVGRVPLAIGLELVREEVGAEGRGAGGFEGGCGLLGFVVTLPFAMAASTWPSSV